MASSSDTANAVRGFVPPQNDDERRLMRRVEELCRVAVSRGIPRYTGFLSDREQSLAQAACNKAGCSCIRFWGGFDAGISCRPTGIISVRFWALALSAAAWGTCWQTPNVRTHFTR